MKHLKHKLDNFLYGYVPGEFMPVWENGELRNRSEYVSYRIKKALTNRTLRVF